MPTCYFCGSEDSMPPWRRPERVFLLSRILRTLRWRYCRTCTRHFLSFQPDRINPASAGPDSGGLVVPDPTLRRRRRRVA